jgi:hypothetical protein
MEEIENGDSKSMQTKFIFFVILSHTHTHTHTLRP